jgi:integrase
MKEQIIEALKAKRPLLSKSSFNTYSILLLNLMKKLNIEDVKDLNNYKTEILEYVKEFESDQTKKTVLSAVIVITDDEDYKKFMAESSRKINDKYRGQKVDLEKLKNMKTMDELKEFRRQLEVKAEKNKMEKDIQNLLLSYFFTGVIDGLPPRRLQDYTELKIKNYNKNTDNYTDGKVLVFNKYKTAKQNGRQIVTIPKEILNTVKKAIRINDTDYLLHNNGNPYNTPSMSKKLKNTYGTSVDGLRAIYISHMYKDLPSIVEMEQTAEAMGHSAETAMKHYIKTDLQR